MRGRWWLGGATPSSACWWPPTRNGVSAVLEHQRYLFVNTDLSVHLKRMPAGEWVCLDAVTYPESQGMGLADTALDERGRIGRAAQTLLVRARRTTPGHKLSADRNGRKASMADVSKVVLITGCSTGIGRATAERLVDRATWCTPPRADRSRSLTSASAAVDVGAGRDRRGLDDGGGGGGRGGGGRRGRPRQQRRLQPERAVESVPIDSVRAQFETNVFGLLRMCQLVLPGMPPAFRPDRERQPRWAAS